MDKKDIRKRLKKELDKDRYEHTKGVMYTAACLAMAYQYDVKKAMIAGLLHDCAKCIPKDEKYRLCAKYDVVLSSEEINNPALVHAKLGAVLAEELYDIHDSEILHAIKVHTTGEPDMSLLDMIIFVADYIEPKREIQPNLDEVRKLAFSDIKQCVAIILSDTLGYLKSKNAIIDMTTQRTYDFYKIYEKE